MKNEFFKQSEGIVKYLVVVLIAMVVISCKENAQIKRMEAQNAQLVSDYQELQAEINRTQNFMDQSAQTLNQVHASLERISTRERLVAEIATNTDGALTGSTKNEIMGYLNAIDGELRRNKRRVNNLQKQINENAIQVTSLNDLIDTLKAQIQEREQRIVDFISGTELLVARYDVVQKQVEEKRQIHERQKTELNAAYYIIDTKKNLKQKGIVEDKGGFLGINKVTKLKPDFSKDGFIAIDIDKMKMIEISHQRKKVKIISPHPGESYKLIEGTDKNSFLEVTDAEEFWKVRYLVIQI